MCNAYVYWKLCCSHFSFGKIFLVAASSSALSSNRNSWNLIYNNLTIMMQANYVAADIAVSLHDSWCLCLVQTLASPRSLSLPHFTPHFSSTNQCVLIALILSHSLYLSPYMPSSKFREIESEGVCVPEKRKFNFTSLNKVRYGSASVLQINSITL